MGMKIALISPAGGGKDLVADYLVKQYGFTRYAFADNVKKVAKQWFPHLYSIDKKPRAMLQKIGTDFREIDEDIWIKSMFKDINMEADERFRLSLAEENIVVTDCRMPNEYQALKDKGFIFIKIEVDEFIRLERLLDRGDIFTTGDLKHSTESHYDTFECDYSLFNNGSALQTYRFADNILVNIEEYSGVQVVL